MLLIGSKALEHYIALDRVIHDWDIWMSESEFREFEMQYMQYLVKQTPFSSIFDINGVIIEVKSERQFTVNDRKIWECETKNTFTIKTKTPFGECTVPDIQTIYDMKCATVAHIPEWKHQYDKELIEKYYPCCILENSLMFQERLEETRIRVEESKKNKHSFFHRNMVAKEKIATIPEYIVHDKLHEMIADLIGLSIPTYVRMINGDVEIDIEAFRKLSYEQKVNLMVEESLVLALERWFIPQMIERGINYHLIEKFYNNNEASGSYLLLVHTNITGLKGEHPEIVQFGRDHFNEIERQWIKAKEAIRANGGFPKWFFEEIFDLRDRYRKGEQVGLHHNRY